MIDCVDYPMAERRNTGFVLITALVAIAVLVAALAVGAAIYRARATDGRAARMAQTQASEMRSIAASLATYMNWADAAWAAGAVQTVPLATLRAHGLAAHLGQRFGRTGISPWGRTYVARAMIGSDGLTRGVVYVSGPPAAGLVKRSGYDGSGELATLAGTVARDLDEAGLHAGAVSAHSSRVAGVAGGFNMDAAPLLAVQDAPTAVVLLGFPELATSNELPPPTELPPGWSTGTRCDVALADGDTDGVCPAGYARITYYPHCGPYNDRPVTFSAKGTPAGMVVFGSAYYVDSWLGAFSSECVWDIAHDRFGGCFIGGPPGMKVYPDADHNTTVVLLQGAKLSEYTCSESTYGFHPVDPDASGCVGGSTKEPFTRPGRCRANYWQYHGRGRDALCCH